MTLNDYLHVPASLFDEGWVEEELQPIPLSLKGIVGAIRPFFNESKNIGVNISLEDKIGPVHIHFSIRHGVQKITDDEAYSILNFFFPGSVITKNKEEFLTGNFWGERSNTGVFSTMRHVRHFIKLIKET